MYQCTKCREFKPFTAFSARPSRPIGRVSYCKSCHAAANKITNAARRPRYKTQMLGWCRKWRQANKDKVAAKSARRRASKISATPAWNIAFFLEEAYDLAKRRSELTGLKWEVDHVVPLRSELVCGLHVHTNIQVIPKYINAAKGNRYWPDMPGS